MREKYEDDFEAGMGAEAIKKLLQQIDCAKLSEQLRAELEEASGQKKAKIVKRLEVVEAFHRSGNRPEWMIIDILPVIPPEIRPMVQLDGGRFRHVRPQRPVPPRHQPQQPSQAPHAAQCAGHHRPQREAHAAGSR